MKSCRPWSRALREAGAILGVAFSLGLLGNALHPAGISWRPVPRTGARAPGDEVFLWLSLPATLRAVETRERVVLDARSEAAWRTGRIPGALPFPIERAHAAFEQLGPLLADPDDALLVYCGRAGCDEGIRLARFLRDQGYRSVAIFPGGLAAWRAAGLPVERTDAR